MVGKDAENFDPLEAMSKARELENLLKMDFETWLKVGYENGWCGAPVCYTHDGLPTSEAEDNVWMEDDDICMHIIRLYEDEAHKRGVEENHSPSQWRASNRGL